MKWIRNGKHYSTVLFLTTLNFYKWIILALNSDGKLFYLLFSFCHLDILPSVFPRLFPAVIITAALPYNNAHVAYEWGRLIGGGGGGQMVTATMLYITYASNKGTKKREEAKTHLLAHWMKLSYYFCPKQFYCFPMPEMKAMTEGYATDWNYQNNIVESCSFACVCYTALSLLLLILFFFLSFIFCPVLRGPKVLCACEILSSETFIRSSASLIWYCWK